MRPHASCRLPASDRRGRTFPPAVAAVAQLACVVLYPGYLTFKTLEHDRKNPTPRADGACTGSSRSVDDDDLADRALDARVGLYRECKLAFSVYLQQPRWQGALYVYDGFSRRFSSRRNPPRTTRWRERLKSSVGSRGEREGERVRETRGVPCVGEGDGGAVGGGRPGAGVAKAGEDARRAD